MSLSSSIVAYAATVLALALAGAGHFVSQTHYNARVALNTAEVKGLSIQRARADLAYWDLHVYVSGDVNEPRVVLYDKAASQQRTIADLLVAHGFSESEITLGVIDYSVQEYRNDAHEVVEATQHLTASVHMETGKVSEVKSARTKLNRLIAEGFNITNEAPTYHFTGLNDIKPAMLREATQNARIAANEFAEDAGVRVGGIRNARQGAFSVVDVGSSYGNTHNVEKEVRVVTNIEFYLTE